MSCDGDAADARFVDDALEEFVRVANELGLSVVPFEPTAAAGGAAASQDSRWQPVAQRAWPMGDFMTGESFLMEVALGGALTQQGSTLTICTPPGIRRRQNRRIL